MQLLDDDGSILVPLVFSINSSTPSDTPSSWLSPGYSFLRLNWRWLRDEYCVIKWGLIIYCLWLSWRVNCEVLWIVSMRHSLIMLLHLMIWFNNSVKLIFVTFLSWAFINHDRFVLSYWILNIIDTVLRRYPFGNNSLSLYHFIYFVKCFLHYYGFLEKYSNLPAANALLQELDSRCDSSACIFSCCLRVPAGLWLNSHYYCWICVFPKQKEVRGSWCSTEKKAVERSSTSLL